MLPCGTPYVKDMRSDDFPETLTDCVQPRKMTQATTKPFHGHQTTSANEQAECRGPQCQMPQISLVDTARWLHLDRLHETRLWSPLELLSLSSDFPVGRLQARKQQGTFKKINQLAADKPFNNLGHQCQVWDWSIVLSIRRVQASLLNPRMIMAWLWLRGMQPCCSDALHRSVIKGSRSERNFLRISVGMGSSSHDLEEAPITAVLTSVTLQGWNRSKVSVASGSSVYLSSAFVLFLLSICCCCRFGE